MTHQQKMTMKRFTKFLSQELKIREAVIKEAEQLGDNSTVYSESSVAEALRYYLRVANGQAHI